MRQKKLAGLTTKRGEQKNKDRIHEYNANYWAKRAERENKEGGETQCSQTY